MTSARPAAVREAPSRVPGPRRAWVAPAVVGASVVAGTAVVALRSPYEGGSYGRCPSLVLFGVYCPFCGGLRAVHDLAHLDLAGASSMNPLLVLAVPVLVALWALWLRSTLRPGRPFTVSSRAAWVTLAVSIAFGVARNLPVLAPWLAPGGA